MSGRAVSDSVGIGFVLRPGIELRVFGKECEVQDTDLQNRPDVLFGHCFYSEKDYNKKGKDKHIYCFDALIYLDKRKEVSAI